MPFKGSTAAAVVILGRNADGTKEWTTALPLGGRQTHGEWLKVEGAAFYPAGMEVGEALNAMWTSFFRELAEKVLVFEQRQPELLQVLREAGVHIQHDEGQPLEVLDPFSFFSLILKHQSEATVASILHKVKAHLNLEGAVPTALDGVPWSNPLNALFFAYRSRRQDTDLPTLWALARQAVQGELNPETFQRALAIRQVALPKLTQGLFWLNPQRFLPLNGVNNPYLESRGVKGASRVTTLAEYQSVLERAAGLAPDYATLSHFAWQQAQKGKQEATLVNGHFPFSQFREDAAQYGDDRVKGNMILDRKYAPLLLDLLADLPLKSLAPSRSPYTGRAQLTLKVSLSKGGVKMEGGPFGRALLLPEDGFEYVPLPQGLTLEVGLPDGKGDGPRLALRAPEARAALVEALLAPLATANPATLSLNSDFGAVGLLPLTAAQRPAVEGQLDSYVQGSGKSRRLRVGVTLTAQELEGEDFADRLEAAMEYLDRLSVVLEELFQSQDTTKPGTSVIQAVSTGPAANGDAQDFTPVPGVPLNQILYGPPGTGKTYRVVDKALAILAPDFLAAHPGPEGRAARKARYDQLAAAGHITFVTFHQNFGYEDFVEGIKPVMKEGQLLYELEDGLFLQAVAAAMGEVKEQEPPDIGVNPQGQVWRIYIDGTAPVSQLRRRTVERGEIRLGSWLQPSPANGPSVQAAPPRPVDFTNASDESLNARQLLFRDSIRQGDVVLLATGQDTIDAVGVVRGEYRFDPAEPIFAADYAHARPVKWLATGLNWSASQRLGKSFAPPALQRVAGVTPEQVLAPLAARPPARASSGQCPHVLIIDEINRGNVAKVLGELITLLEPSKRQGAKEALTVRLPLSKRPLSVPQSLYVIGTMNTADRSLTLLDAALRRRFVFEPIEPEPDVLPVITIEGTALHLPMFLRAINTRIERMLSREQVIGHAYLLDVPETLEGVAQAVQQRILPLLEEYFFEDWGQIRKVLGDDQKPGEQQFIREFKEGDVKRYERNKAAFESIEAFVRVYSGTSDAPDEE